MFQFRAFPAYDYLIHRTLTRYCRAGFPHSEISGSMRMCRSPKLIAACRVLLRLLMPRHSPCALFSLIYFLSWLSFRIMQVTEVFDRSNCSFYPKFPQSFCSIRAACPLLPCFFFHFHCSVFKVQIPGQRPDQNAQKALSVLIHSLVVEISGIEPLTSCVQSRRSPI